MNGTNGTAASSDDTPGATPAGIDSAMNATATTNPSQNQTQPASSAPNPTAAQSSNSTSGTMPAASPDPDSEPSPPPGYLATRLDTVFGNALAHTLKTCSYGNFAACFPTPAARRPDVLRLVWRQIVDKIETKARAEYAGIMAERDVVRGLNELEALLGEARARKERSEEEDGERPVAPHTLPPETLFAAHLAPELEPIARDLQAKIDALAAENDVLYAGITKQKDDVEALVKHLEAVVKDLEGANATLDSALAENKVRKEVLQIQKDLSEVDAKS